MHKKDIKYKTIPNEDDDNNDFDQYKNDHHKMQRITKFLIVCFIFVQLLFVVYNYKNVIVSVISRINETSKDDNAANQAHNDVDPEIVNTGLLPSEKMLPFQEEDVTSINNYFDQVTENTTRFALTSQSTTSDTEIYFRQEQQTTEVEVNPNDNDEMKSTMTTIINPNKSGESIDTSSRRNFDYAYIYSSNTIYNNSHDIIELTTTKTSTSVINYEYYEQNKIITLSANADTSSSSTYKLPSTQKISLPTIIASIKSRKYFINTSKCHIPAIDPFTREARKIFKPSNTTGCTNDKAIVTVAYDENSQRYHLNIDYSVALVLSKNSSSETIGDDLHCCYREILRSGSGGSVDKRFKLLPCTNFQQHFVVPAHINAIIVDCKSKITDELVQQDAFSFIQFNQQFETTKIPPKPEMPSSLNQKLGILLIGIDTMSRINFRRNMPETFKYLTDKKWHELKGYNKVGENTLPNLMPLLTGYTAGTSYSKCKPRTPGGFDNCNFIWTKFHDHGFATAYAEDSTTLSTFNYIKAGFKIPPTDYYYRPIALAIEKTLKRKNKYGLVYCLGRRQYGEYIYDYGLEFATRYRNHSHFGLFWTNSFTHGSFNTAATMDRKMLNYLKELETRGILQKSFVMFFSDHGCRWGPLLKLPEGFLEERLPMFFMSLPDWFKQQYPGFVRNFETNQQRLTTPFDIHMTMQHLLHMSVPAYNITPALDCPTAQSLFYEVPENRTCDKACIPQTWCTCLPYMIQPTNGDIVKNITHMILGEINQYIVHRNLTSLCSKLTLAKISRAKLRDQDITNPSNMSTYAIEFITNPKTKPTTEFSATVDYDPKLQKIKLNVEEISRQSKYENTAKCINDKEGKKYCICKNSLKS